MPITIDGGGGARSARYTALTTCRPTLAGPKMRGGSFQGARSLPIDAAALRNVPQVHAANGALQKLPNRPSKAFEVMTPPRNVLIPGTSTAACVYRCWLVSERVEGTAIPYGCVAA